MRAVMLWRFAQFTQWPAASFPSADTPLVIGVLGENPFGGALKACVRGETAHGHPIEVRHFSRVQDAAGSAHILYISQSEANHLKEIHAALDNKPILTVSDIEGFAQDKGGMIRFITEKSRVGLQINMDAAKTAHLVLDSRLLRMAEVVGSQ